MMISSGLCGRAGTCLFFFPTMFIRQTGYQVSQCVYGKAGRGGFRLVEVGRCPLYSLFPFLAFPSISHLSRFFSLRCPFIPSCPPWWTSLGL